MASEEDGPPQSCDGYSLPTVKTARRRSTLVGEKVVPPPTVAATKPAASQGLATRMLSLVGVGSSSPSSKAASAEEAETKKQQRREAARKVAGVDPSARIQPEAPQSHLDFRPASPARSRQPEVPTPRVLASPVKAAVEPSAPQQKTLLQQLREAQSDAAAERESFLNRISALEVSAAEAQAQLAMKDDIIAEQDKALAAKDGEILHRLSHFDELRIKLKNAEAAAQDAETRAKSIAAQLAETEEEAEAAVHVLQDQMEEMEAALLASQQEAMALKEEKKRREQTPLDVQDQERLERQAAELKRLLDIQKEEERALYKYENELELLKKEMDARQLDLEQQRARHNMTDEELVKKEQEQEKWRALIDEEETELQSRKAEVDYRRSELDAAIEQQRADEQELYRKEVDMEQQKRNLAADLQMHELGRKKWQDDAQDLYRRGLELEMERKRQEALVMASNSMQVNKLSDEIAALQLQLSASHENTEYEKAILQRTISTQLALIADLRKQLSLVTGVYPSDDHMPPPPPTASGFHPALPVSSSNPPRSDSPVAAPGESLLHYNVLDRVEAQFEGSLGCTEWFPGTITLVREDNSYDIRYDDGDEEEAVDVHYIRALDH